MSGNANSLVDLCLYSLNRSLEIGYRDLQFQHTNIDGSNLGTL